MKINTVDLIEKKTNPKAVVKIYISILIKKKISALGEESL